MFLFRIYKRFCYIIRDFKIRDATASRTRWLINGLGLERRRLRGKSKVKISVWMKDDAAAKRSLSVRFFGISFAEIAMASLQKVHEMLCLCLIEEIIDKDEFFCFNTSKSKGISLFSTRKLALPSARS